jgi:hypothetical protein
MSRAVTLGAFVWIVSVDDDEPIVIVALGHDDTDEGEPNLWFALDADGAQAMGGALIRAYGELMRRAHALPRLDTDLNRD